MKTKIEDFIKEKSKVNICAIYKEFSDIPKQEISTIISVLIVTNNWRIEQEKGRLFITSTAGCDKCQKQTTVQHIDGSVDIIPKQIPVNGDWVVTSLTFDSRLFFDKRYTSDEVRGSYVKSEKVKFSDTRPKRYHKKSVLIEAKGQNY